MNKTALITGASAGLGAEYAWLFAQDGHDVVLVARRKDKLDALSAAIQEKHPGVQAHVLPEDLAAQGAADRVAEKLQRAERGLLIGLRRLRQLGDREWLAREI